MTKSCLGKQPLREEIIIFKSDKITSICDSIPAFLMPNPSSSDWSYSGVKQKPDIAKRGWCITRLDLIAADGRARARACLEITIGIH